MENLTKIDFNGEPVIAEETGQVLQEKEETGEVKEVEGVETPTEITNETQVEPTESVEKLKTRLEKLEEEKENYKKGMLKYKKELTLDQSNDDSKESEKDGDEEVYPDWDETSKKFQKQTLNQAEKIAGARAQQIISEVNEKAAIQEFIEKNPGTEKIWNEIVTNYNPKSGKTSIKSILKDLDKAYILTRYEKGELTNLEQDAFKKGESKGKAESQLAELNSVSKTNVQSEKEGKSLSSGALKLAEKMRVDLKKLAEEDDSLTAEIKF